MNNKNYNIEEKAKEILNVLQKQDVDLENINYDKLEQLLKDANKTDNNKYLNVFCPHCASNIYLCITNNEGTKIFKEKYDCTSCGNGFNVEYDIVLEKLNIVTNMSLINK
ncbi:TPA: hypothetical protein LA460_000296 [Clostridium botulinum]|nr:hypothetical protein [Clostridium botulinum]HBJ1652900.1 hypothetical protein [Clostridium botulinum]